MTFLTRIIHERVAERTRAVRAGPRQASKHSLSGSRGAADACAVVRRDNDGCSAALRTIVSTTERLGGVETEAAKAA